MKNEFTTIADRDALLAFLQRKGRNHTCYYHYTSWDSFCKIYESSSMLLTRGNSLSINDQQEALMKGAWEEWEKIYIGSFAFGTAENMAMWGLYSLPWEDAVRIAIPKKAMLRWIDGIGEVFLWNQGEKEARSAEICLRDLVYVNGKTGSEQLQLTYKDTTFWTSNRPALYGIDKDPKMTGFIKSFPWHYENEVRLHVRLEERTGFEKIKIPMPKEVLDEIWITTGPSFEEKNDALYQMLQNAGRIRPSEFKDLVRYRPLCKLCQHKAFVKKSD